MYDSGVAIPFFLELELEPHPSQKEPELESLELVKFLGLFPPMEPVLIMESALLMELVPMEEQ